MSYQGMLADTVKFRGHNGDTGEAYYAWPTGAGQIPGRGADPPHAGLG